MLGTDQFLTYVQCFHVTNPPVGQTMDAGAVRLHFLKHATRNNGERVRGVLLLSHLRSPVHLIPHFGKTANPHLSNMTSYELSTEF